MTLKILKWNEVVGDTPASGKELKTTDVEFRR